MAKARGDRSRRVGSTKMSKGPAAPQGSMARTPKGRPISDFEGREGRTNNGMPAGTPYRGDS